MIITPKILIKVGKFKTLNEAHRMVNQDLERKALFTSAALKFTSKCQGNKSLQILT